MKMKILSSVVFSTLLFASMYSEAAGTAAANAANKPGVGGRRGPAPAGSKAGQGATASRRNLVQQRIDTARGDGLSNLTRTSGRVFSTGVQGTQVRENGDLLSSKRENEVVQDVNVTQTLINAGTNQSHKLSPIFAGLFSKDSETATTLAKVVNGTNAHLRASVLKLNEQAKKGTHQFGELMRIGGTFIASVSGLSARKSQPNQDPFKEEVSHVMANNVGDALLWVEPAPKRKFFNILADAVAGRNTHPQGVAGALVDSIQRRFQLVKEKIGEKLREINTKCRA